MFTIMEKIERILARMVQEKRLGQSFVSPLEYRNRLDRRIRIEKKLTGLMMIVLFFLYCPSINAMTVKTVYRVGSSVRNGDVRRPVEKSIKTETVRSSDSVYSRIPSLTEKEGVARYFADKFGINSETLLCTLRGESGIEGYTVKSGYTELKCGDNGKSCGIGQIQLPTWKSMRKHAGWSTEDLRGNDFENIRTTAYGMSTVWAEHWTAYRNCKAKGYKLFSKS